MDIPAETVYLKEGVFLPVFVQLTFFNNRHLGTKGSVFY